MIICKSKHYIHSQAGVPVRSRNLNVNDNFGDKEKIKEVLRNIFGLKRWIHRHLSSNELHWKFAITLVSMTKQRLMLHAIS